jgi:signal transduction histidine kinase
MPVKLRITLLFTLLVFVVLLLVCSSVYYFSYNARIDTVKTRLTNRAITVGRLLSRTDVFSNELIQRLDSATTIALTNNVIQAYDYQNNKIYGYSSLAGDSLAVGRPVLQEARVKKHFYYTVRTKDVVAYYYTDNNARIVLIAAGEDFDGKQNLKKLFKILLLSLCGGLATAFLGGYFFSEGLLKPVKKIADEVNDISAQNFSRRINTPDVKDEWYYLSDTLNALLNRLQESFDLQKRFIANASHELSTPLTSISSQIEVSLQRERGVEDYRTVLKSIHQDVLHMSKLTKMLLDLAKASGDPGGLRIALVRMDEVLFRLPAEIAKINKGYSVSLQFDQLPDEQEKLMVFGNEELLFTAIKNIAINGCKYSTRHEAVVKLSIKDEEIIITVQDKGIGIPEAELSHIFQPFYRVGQDGIEEGFGLGLSLTSRIIKLHNGKVKASSNLGKGSLFTILLPVATALNVKL